MSKAEYKPNHPLTGDQVRQMFAMRAKGTTQIDIGKRFGCSDSHVSTILNRKIYGEVVIPENLIKACKNPTVKRAPYKRKPKDTDTLPLAMAAFTTACIGLGEARERCAALGVTGVALTTIEESLRGVV